LPGTGKTSFIFSLASHFGYHVAVLNFDKKIDDTTFIKSLKHIPNRTILILEDIDVLFSERKTGDEYKNMISFSVLLNVLDGLSCKDGLITFMTTNYVENLDSALIRPGRVDHFIKFTYANKQQTLEMYNTFFPEHSKLFEPLWEKLNCRKYTTAMLQQFFFMYYETPEECINNINKLDYINNELKDRNKCDMYS
jgi:chaperone BCS1